MRLSPKSIFFGLVSLGLPIAVTVGWILGEPATSQTSAAATPGGAGGIGGALVTIVGVGTGGFVSGRSVGSEGKGSGGTADVGGSVATGAMLDADGTAAAPDDGVAA